MRSQSATSGVNARGSFVDLQEYDQKLKPSPLVPRKKLKKEADVNGAFMRGFLDELEKKGAAGALLARGLSAGRGVLGKVAPAGSRLQRGASWLGGQIKKDPMMAAQFGAQALSGVRGSMQGRGEAKAQHRAAQAGQAPVTAKKKTGFMAGLGLRGSQ